MSVLIEVKNLCKSFEGQRVLTNLTFDVFQGETLAIMGPSGIGKSTLLNIIARVDSDFEGSLNYHESLFENVVAPLPIVFQGNETLMPWLTAQAHLTLVNPQMSLGEIDEILDSVGLLDHKDKRPKALSGGMKQRLSFARAMAMHSKILLLDEPFSNLDQALKASLYELLVDIKKKRNLTLIIVTHDENEARALCARRLNIHAHKVEGITIGSKLEVSSEYI